MDAPELPLRYEDRGRLGEGAIGEVRRVYDRVLDATLAMKILRFEHAGSRDRFVAEARTTARLNHPGIVAVQDLGELPDGRAWFTMEEVQGRTLAEVIDEHRRRGASLRRLVDHYARVCEAVAYAHTRGVVHRDLKPENVMVGAFGELRVMDWGLARGSGAPDAGSGPDDRGPGEPRVVATGTSSGAVLGTPGYMPPEQAAGRSGEVGAEADVYTLGAILYTILCGQRPYAPLGGRDALSATRQGPPRPVREVASAPIPDALVALCEACMARAPERRPATAELVAAVRDWLEGARKEAEARVLLERALALRPAVADLEARAAALEAEAARVLDGVAPFAPMEQKLPAWRLEEAATEARREAIRLEEALQRGLRAALGQAPELDAAHDALADLYQGRLLRAEARGEAFAAADAEALLREHDRGRHAAWLRGDGAITLVTEPPGATVELYRYIERDRRLVEVYERTLGPSPIHEIPVARGSLVLRVLHPERAPVRYPVFVGRLEHWDGVRPGGDRPHPIFLPPRIGEDERYVPAGWFHSGGDPAALDALPARRLWVDGLFVRRDPITNAEYTAWLEMLAAAGRDAELAAALPGGLTEAAVLVRRVGARFLLGTAEGRALLPREPVVFLTPEQLDAYAAAQAERDGLPWRLPHEQEWEKAARGVDGRIYPWGSRFEPTWTRMQSSVEGAPGRAEVHALPSDVGPYGVRGAAGNVRDLCQNGYRKIHGGEVVMPAPAGPDEPHRVVRGGSWTSAEWLCRLAVRLTTRPGVGNNSVGGRLVRSLG